MPLGIVSYRGLRARDQGSTGAESLSSHSLDPHAVVTPGFNVKGKDGITFVTISGKRPKTWPEQKMDIFIIFAVWSQEFLPLFSRQKTIAVGTVNQTTQLLLLPPFSLSSLPPYTRRGFSIRQPPHLVCNDAFLPRRARSSVSRTPTHKATSTTSSINNDVLASSPDDQIS